MITIGCAGFPVPATRYFKEFLFVEVPDGHITTPGGGTIRRWRREAPAGFGFSMMAPKELGLGGFPTAGEALDTALTNLTGVGTELASGTVVITSPLEFPKNKANRSLVKEFLKSLRGKFARIVWEAPPDWDADDAAALAEDVGAVAARDPFHHGKAHGPFGYYRLPGPAGFKSRYEDPAIERIAFAAGQASHEEAIYVFANVDMYADGKRLRKALKV